MVCIYCGSKTKVTNSRSSVAKASTWRRRECLQCLSIVTTRETADYAEALRVKTKNGLEPFLRDKLLLSIHFSVSHRKTALTDATQLTDTIINSLLKLANNGLLETSNIRANVLKTLQRFDAVAGAHYEAHHR